MQLDQRLCLAQDVSTDRIRSLQARFSWQTGLSTMGESTCHMDLLNLSLHSARVEKTRAEKAVVHLPLISDAMSCCHVGEKAGHVTDISPNSLCS